MKKIFIIIATLGVLLTVIVLSKRDVVDSGIQSVDQNTESVRDTAPNFTLTDYDGNIVSLSDFRGEHVVVNVWATWCPFCVKELPDFVSVQQEFSDEVTFIAINRKQSQEKSEKFLEGIGISVDDLLFLSDPDDSVYRSIGGFSMPETLFIDPQGRIVEHKRGVLSAEESRDAVVRLLVN